MLVSTQQENDNILSKDMTSVSDQAENNENTLGSLVINSTDLTGVSEVKSSEIKIEADLLQNKKDKSPEEEFQNAFDLIRNQQFSDAEEALQKFIETRKDDKLLGSAHYWLGEIYLLKKEYRKSALILAEGYQNFSSSFKVRKPLLVCISANKPSPYSE